MRIRARKVVRGRAEGEALVLARSLSFLGDVDMGNAQILIADDPNYGVPISGRVLIYQDTKGSSGGADVLLALRSKGLAPSALVAEMPVDYSMAEAAILAKIPFLCEPESEVVAKVQTGCSVIVDADKGILEVS